MPSPRGRRLDLQNSQICLELLTRQLGDWPEALELLTGIQQAQDDLHRLYEEVRDYAADRSGLSILPDQRPHARRAAGHAFQCIPFNGGGGGECRRWGSARLTAAGIAGPGVRVA